MSILGGERALNMSLLFLLKLSKRMVIYQIASLVISYYIDEKFELSRCFQKNPDGSILELNPQALDRQKISK